MTNLCELILLVFIIVCVQLSFGFVVKNSTDSEGEERLIFAQVLFRHGAINIKKTYPNDPYQDVKYWPGGFGALSNDGKQEAYELGKYLRRRYQHFIGDQYSSDKVYIRSTDTDRCLMSSQCLTAGLFPPSDTEIWNEDFNWQPIPIHTIALEDDYLLNSKVECPRTRLDFNQQLYTPEMKSLMEEHRPLIEFIDHHSGMRIRNVDDVLTVYNVLLAQTRRRWVLPDWAYEVMKYNQTLDYFGALSYKAFVDTTETKKMQAGFLIKEILDRFVNKTLGLLQPDRLLRLYSAHGTKIVSVLNALDVFDMRKPTFSSSIHFELYQRGADFYIQIFYRKPDADIVSPLEIPNCGTKCPLEKLHEMYDDILPKESEDFHSLCALD